MVSLFTSGLVEGFAKRRSEHEIMDWETRQKKEERNWQANQNKLNRENQFKVARLQIEQRQKQNKISSGWTAWRNLAELHAKAGRHALLTDVPESVRESFAQIGIKTHISSGRPEDLDVATGVEYYNMQIPIDAADASTVREFANKTLLGGLSNWDNTPNSVQKEIAKRFKNSNTAKIYVNAAFSRVQAQDNTKLINQYIQANPKALATAVQMASGTKNIVSLKLTPGAAISLYDPGLVSEQQQALQAKQPGGIDLIKLGNLRHIENQITNAKVTGNISVVNYLQKYAAKSKLKDDFQSFINNSTLKWTDISGAKKTRFLRMNTSYPELFRLLQKEFDIKTPKDKHIKTVKDIVEATGLPRHVVLYKLRKGQLKVEGNVLKENKISNTQHLKPPLSEITITEDSGSVPKQNSVPPNPDAKQKPPPILTKKHNDGTLGSLPEDFNIDTNEDMADAISLYHLASLEPDKIVPGSDLDRRYKIFKPLYTSIENFSNVSKGIKRTPEGKEAYKKLYNLISEGYTNKQGNTIKLFDFSKSTKKHQLIRGFIREGMARYHSITQSTKQGSSWSGGKQITTQSELIDYPDDWLKKNDIIRFNAKKEAGALRDKLNKIVPMVDRYSTLRDRIGAISRAIENSDNLSPTELVSFRQEILNDPHVRHSLIKSGNSTQSAWQSFIQSDATRGSEFEGAAPAWVVKAAQVVRDLGVSLNMVGDMFDITKFKTVISEGKTINPGIPGFDSKLTSAQWSTVHDTENDHIGKKVMERFETVILPELRQKHTALVKKASQ